MSSRRDMLIPASEGVFARLAHVDLPAGTYEREVGRDGFHGPATHFYHARPPTGFDSIEGSIRPRAFNPTRVSGRSASPWDAARLFHNRSLQFRFWRPDGVMSELVRNADGDELIFVHRGAGDFFCDYGHFEYRESDYILIPRGTMWRLAPKADTELLLIESTGAPYRMPDWGGIGRHAPIDYGAFVRPQLNDTFRAQQGPGRWSVRVKRANAIGTINFPYNPLDAVGWKGDLYPLRFSLHDIRPLMSHKVHLPPSAYTTFLGSRFVVCSFVPRPMESAPGAMKVPFFHNNDDYDEILFLHRGDVPSRGNALGEGGITYHPMGFTHGPHPQALEHMFDPELKEAAAYAIMIDALDPIEVADLPAGCEVEGYAESWRAGGH